jgi:AraC-like DNA-binding protein
VFLPHAVPVDTAPYRQFFRAPMRFNAEFCALRFPESVMNRPIEGADAARLRAALAEARAGGKAILVQGVYRTLRTLLLHGRSSGADVARVLMMHRRTLNRRLSAEGTTFQRVLDDVRFAVAKELLENSAVSMHDVAAALGYAGLAPFMRAFRRWSGTSPGEWRKSMRAA